LLAGDELTTRLEREIGVSAEQIATYPGVSLDAFDDVRRGNSLPTEEAGK